jgi:hypothetical protein
MKDDQPTHGGQRKGAGRPASDTKLKRVDIMLRDEDIAKASRIGFGNRSLGIRRALEKYSE